MAFSYVGNFPNQQVSNSGVLSLDDINNLESTGELGGSLELIEEKSISGVSSAIFTSIKQTKYDVHFLEIKNYGHEEQKKKLIAGIVLTGGGSQLKHLKQLVEYITGMDTRLGSPNEHLAGNNLIEI